MLTYPFSPPGVNGCGQPRGLEEVAHREHLEAAPLSRQLTPWELAQEAGLLVASGPDSPGWDFILA